MDNKSKVAGTSLPEFTATYVGFAGGENANVLGGKLSLSVPPESINKSGEYVIDGTTSTLTSKNYSIQIVNGSLTVVSAAPSSLVTVSDGNQSVKVNREFASPMKLRVLDPFGNVVPGATVVFTAPSSKPSGSFVGGATTETVTTGANGEAESSLFTAGAEFGDYVVLATVNSLTASFALSNVEAGKPLELSLSDILPWS